MNGQFVTNLSGGSFGFSDPNSVAFDGRDVWVTNAGGAGSLTALIGG